MTQDVDFFERAALHRFPPKIIWMRCGNQRTAYIEGLIRNNVDAITDLESDRNVACLEIS